ncbi:glycerophosphodiester phosphodiesterase family protein [Thalassolituus sp. LLYu03]|uniref:glycerophosphodiester phosphodiesterase family protein n=1 Tax=Thalassolituus sp. LLYu03 TaxID=3421656 RepID=UPI003D27EC88
MPSRMPPGHLSAYEYISPVIAHRGACGEAPENTKASIELAARQGAHWAEVDVTISADGVAVIHHDADLSRCSDGSGLVIQKKMAELKALDAGSWFAPQFQGETVMTLAELLTLANHLDLSLNLEVKPTIGREAETVWAIAQTLKAVPFDHPLILSSFNIHALHACKTQLPHLTRALNVEAIPRNFIERLEEAGCQGLHFQKEFADAAQIQAVRQAGYHLLTFTVNDPDTARNLLQMGVSGVFCDFPGRMLAALNGGRFSKANH